MPPFGNLYGMDVYISHALAEEEEIAFNAGSHTVLIKMNYKDYDNLVRPHTVDTFERVPVMRAAAREIGWLELAGRLEGIQIGIRLIPAR